MTESVYQNFDIDDPLGVIAEQNRGRFLEKVTLDWFSVRGIGALNLIQTWVGWSDYVRLDDVVFLPRGAFEFSRYKLDYPAERVLGDSPWNAMNTNCATSSRSVMVFIQRRTAVEALTGEVRGAGRRRDGGSASAAEANVTNRKKDRTIRTTVTV